MPTLTLRKDMPLVHARVVLYLAGSGAGGAAAGGARRRAWGTVDGFVTVGTSTNMIPGCPPPTPCTTLFSTLLS